MQNELILELCRTRLRIFLAQEFEAVGTDLDATIKIAAELLPSDLADPLIALGQELDKGAGPDEPNVVCDLVFRAGQTVEALSAYRRARLDPKEAPMGEDGVVTMPTDPAELDALARLVEWRDRTFRKVADFTLKAILIAAGLLIVAELLGLV